VIITEAHCFAGLQRIERTKNSGVPETLGDSTGIERVKRFGCGVVADVKGLHISSRKGMPGWHRALILPF
jgi:hypothetical protein